jgi:hypothetical protein
MTKGLDKIGAPYRLRMLRMQSSGKGTKMTVIYLDRIQAHSLHALQAVSPIGWMYAVVVDAARTARDSGIVK